MMTKKINDPNVFDVHAFELRATRGPAKRKGTIVTDAKQKTVPWWNKMIKKPREHTVRITQDQPKGPTASGKAFRDNERRAAIVKAMIDNKRLDKEFKTRIDTD